MSEDPIDPEDDAPDDEADHGLEALLEHVRLRCQAHGDPGAAERLLLKRAGGDIAFSSLDAAACGSSISGFLRGEQRMRTLDTALNRILRFRLRERLIGEAGETGSPAWSIDMHRAVLAVFVNSGIHPLLIAMGVREDDRHPSGHLADEMERLGIAVTDFQFHGGRLSPTTLTLRKGGVDDALVLYTASVGGETGLILRGLSLPESVMASAVGRRLDAVVRHPLLEGAGHLTITHLDEALNSVTIVTDDERVPLAPSPVGTPWLDVPWNPGG